MLSAPFEPAFPASERPPTYALDRAAAGIGLEYNTAPNIVAVGHNGWDEKDK
jgi:hypothetical protein